MRQSPLERSRRRTSAEPAQRNTSRCSRSSPCYLAIPSQYSHRCSRQPSSSQNGERLASCRSRPVEDAQGLIMLRIARSQDEPVTFDPAYGQFQRRHAACLSCTSALQADVSEHAVYACISADAAADISDVSDGLSSGRKSGHANPSLSARVPHLSSVPASKGSVSESGCITLGVQARQCHGGDLSVRARSPMAGAHCGESVVDQENFRQCVRSPSESPPRVSCIAMLQG